MLYQYDRSEDQHSRLSPDQHLHCGIYVPTFSDLLHACPNLYAYTKLKWIIEKIIFILYNYINRFSMVCVCTILFYFKTGSHVSQTGLKLAISPKLTLKCSPLCSSVLGSEVLGFMQCWNKMQGFGSKKQTCYLELDSHLAIIFFYYLMNAFSRYDQNFTTYCLSLKNVFWLTYKPIYFTSTQFNVFIFWRESNYNKIFKVNSISYCSLKMITAN